MKAVLEDLPVGRQQSIHAFKYRAASFATPWHFHPQHELTVIEASSGTKFIGDYVGPYEPGEVVLLHGGLPHCWKEASGEGCASSVVQWSPEAFAPVAELRPVFSLLREARRGVLFSTADTEELRPRIASLSELSAADRYAGLLSLLMALAERPRTTLSRTDFQEGPPAEYRSRMQRIHRFVEDSFHRRVTLAEAAAQIHLSEQAFNRFFRQAMGRSFFPFLNEYRVQRACRLLVGTDWPVARIAAACGFPSLPFFHRQFRRFADTTPLRYRRRHPGSK